MLNGKWGFIDKEGTEILPCKYERAAVVSKELLAVFINGKWGFINRSGAAVTPFKYDGSNPIRIHFVHRPSKWGFSDGMMPVLQNGRWGYIDAHGNEVISCKYTKSSSFIDGLAMVELYGKRFCINKKGEKIK